MTKLSPRALNALFVMAIIVLLLPFALDAYRSLRNEKIGASLGGTDSSKITVEDGADLFTDAEEAKIR
ncbi:MAG: hypothetical protein J5830_00420, partial [Clostridia bacterium]|nr:hypothetical protein [Clostridia bacterium]